MDDPTPAEKNGLVASGGGEGFDRHPKSLEDRGVRGITQF
jgi:hypothetical protein